MPYFEVSWIGQRCLRYDFDFFFALQEVVNDLVEVDFLFEKEKPLRNYWSSSNHIFKMPHVKGRSEEENECITLPSGVFGPLYGSTSPSFTGHSS